MFDPFSGFHNHPYRKPIQQQAFHNYASILHIRLSQKSGNPSFACLKKTPTIFQQIKYQRLFKGQLQFSMLPKPILVSQRETWKSMFDKATNLGEYRQIIWSKIAK